MSQPQKKPTVPTPPASVYPQSFSMNDTTAKIAAKAATMRSIHGLALYHSRIALNHSRIPVASI